MFVRTVVLHVIAENYAQELFDHKKVLASLAGLLTAGLIRSADGDAVAA